MDINKFKNRKGVYEFTSNAPGIARITGIDKDFDGELPGKITIQVDNLVSDTVVFRSSIGVSSNTTNYSPFDGNDIFIAPGVGTGGLIASSEGKIRHLEVERTGAVDGAIVGTIIFYK